MVHQSQDRSLTSAHAQSEESRRRPAASWCAFLRTGRDGRRQPAFDPQFRRLPEQSRHALRWAAALAAGFGSRLTVASVVDPRFWQRPQGSNLARTSRNRKPNRQGASSLPRPGPARQPRQRRSCSGRPSATPRARSSRQRKRNASNCHDGYTGVMIPGRSPCSNARGGLVASAPGHDLRARRGRHDYAKPATACTIARRHAVPCAAAQPGPAKALAH